MAGQTKSPQELPFHLLHKPPSPKDLLRAPSLWVVPGHCGLSLSPFCPCGTVTGAVVKEGKAVGSGYAEGGGRGVEGCLVSRALCLPPSICSE